MYRLICNQQFFYKISFFLRSIFLKILLLSIFLSYSLVFAQTQSVTTSKQIVNRNAPLIREPISNDIKIVSESSANKTDSQFKSENMPNIINGLIAAFTFCLVLIAYKQLRMFRLQLKSMEKTLMHSSEASAAAKASADAAKIANEVNRASQRPWVVIKEVKASSAFDTNNGLSFTFVIQNVGNTPGQNIDVSAVMHLAHRGDVHEVQRNISSDQIKTRQELSKIKEINFGHLVVPGEDLEISVRAENQMIEYQKAANMSSFGEIIIFIVGQVSYWSGIDQNWHESGFMFAVNKLGGEHIRFTDIHIPIEAIEIKRFPAGFYAT